MKHHRLTIVESLTLVLVALSAVLATPARAQPGIVAGPFQYEGNTYYVLEEATWTESGAAARAMGGHLITINDAAENEWVFQNITPHSTSHNGIWIGLNDEAVEGRWVWSSGQPVDYTNWLPGEPNGRTGENWVHLYPVGHNEASFWNDNSNVPTSINGSVEIEGVSPLLTVTPNCPSGGPIRIEWSGATPGGQIALIFARNTGSFIIPNNMPCAGTQLGLGANQIQLAWQGGAGPNGSRTLNATAGPAACGGHLQLLDLTRCATSNVVRVE